MALNLGTTAVMPARSAGIQDFVRDPLYAKVVDTRTLSGHDGARCGLIGLAAE